MSKRLVNKENRFENATQWITEAFDLEKRKVMLSADVDEAPASKLIRAIQKMLEVDAESPIDVYINSYGGSVYDGLALYDTLESASCIVRTHALGKVCSMGFILFLAGDERYSMDRARFMHHESGGHISGSLSELKLEVREFDEIEEICNTIVEEKTNKSDKWWQNRIAGKDFWFGKKEAREFGVVTHEYEGRDE